MVRKEGDWNTAPLEKLNPPSLIDETREGISEVLERATMQVKEHDGEARRFRALAAQHDEAAKMWAQILSGTSAEVNDNPFEDD